MTSGNWQDPNSHPQHRVQLFCDALVALSQLSHVLSDEPLHAAERPVQRVLKEGSTGYRSNSIRDAFRRARVDALFQTHPAHKVLPSKSLP